MWHRALRRAVVATWLLASGGFNALGIAEPVLDVSHRARSVQPGEVVILDVRVTPPATAVTADVFGASVRFHLSETDESTEHAAVKWSALVGIDLDTAAGAYPVTIEATLGTGDIVQSSYELRVEPKQFPTRRLTVAPNYVNPPADTMERIEREFLRQQGIFETSTADRMWRGGFLPPVPGEPSSSFGRRSVFNGEARSPHSGTDFRSGTGTPIKAPNRGVVVLAENLYFSGNAVIIDHGRGLYSFFAHLSEIGVSEGDVLEQGSVVGAVGATGRVTGAHLHWTVRLNTARVDPIALMTLLPAN